LFRIVHSFSLTIFVTLAWACASYAQGVPVTSEGAIPGLAAAVRDTCDPAIEEVIRHQAWEAAQLEITQNANIYARPDSVLSLSCFDSWLNHQATYAANNFPVDPDESEGGVGGVFTDIMVVLPDDIITSVDPNLTVGYVQYGILEILVLDQLENVHSISGIAADATGFSFCGGSKDYYIADAFPDLMIGDRAKNQAAVPAYSPILSTLDNSVSDSSAYNCDMMARVWQRTKCYDFATEEKEFYAGAGGYSGPNNHDGFYTYEDYVATANAGKDYRTEPEMCDPPDNRIVKIPNAANLACWDQIHGVAGMPGWSNFIPGFAWIGGTSFTGGGKSWNDINDAANPLAGTAGGGDVYNHYLELVSGDTAISCAPPIRTGNIVMRTNRQYYDAVCPNPGCFFVAPNTLAGIGSCTR
jgi:hypothetical protein